MTSDAEGNMSVMLFVAEPHQRWKSRAVTVDCKLAKH